jgi:MoaA/NifB/PqqE/SkfB family radical SAM enzyme
LKYTGLVYLQGWGEPLLHKDIFEMIRLCKKKGRRTGFTTNGMLLDKETAARLVELELDILCVSLAGCRPETHNSIRQGTDLEQIYKNLEYLASIKERNAAAMPALHFAYFMLESNFHELKHIIPIAKKFGVKQIIASNPVIIVNDEIRQKAPFNSERNGSYCEELMKIKEDAADKGIEFKYSAPVINPENPGCPENICASCFIDAEGRVGPCVYTSPAVSSSAVTFGDLSSGSLTKIWNKEEFYNFRKMLCSEQLENMQEKLPDSCKSCLKRMAAWD